MLQSYLVQPTGRTCLPTRTATAWQQQRMETVWHGTVGAERHGQVEVRQPAAGAGQLSVPVGCRWTTDNQQ